MKSIILFAFVCITSNVLAQEKPITFNKEIIYRVVYQPDSNNKNNVKEEYAVLRLNDSVSIFRTIGKSKLDSAHYAEIRNGNSGILPTSFYIENRTDIHYTILKERDSILHYEELHSDLLHPYFYAEPKDVLEWEIASDTMTIGNVLCQKAMVNFGGRKWLAWFARDIPVYDGPYKFCNLPGLILSVYDVQEYWRFDLISINPDIYGETRMYVANGLSPSQTAKKDFFKKKVVYNENIFEMLLAEGRFKGVSREALARVRKFYKNESESDNNWIELYP